VNRVIFVEKPVAALLLNANIVAGNAARQWLAGDSSKPRICARCEKQGTRENGCLPLEIWSKNQKFRNSEESSSISIY